MTTEEIIEEEAEYFIWDKVQLIADTKNRVYTIYSYTVYDWGRISFTLWHDDEYDVYEPWQIKKYVPTEPIWFNQWKEDGSTDK